MERCGVCRGAVAYEGQLGTDCIVYCEECNKNRPNDVRKSKMQNKQYWSMCSAAIKIEYDWKKVCANCEYENICQLR